jgi:S-DNA-T family DNA segregation ATPase FtsK/SpoIIIE
MSDDIKSLKTTEQLETEIIALKVRIARVESYLRDLPNADDYVDSLTEDELFEEAKKVVMEYDRASASLLQRRLSMGYARAARLIDQLEAKGIIAPSDGSSKPREVLLKKDE